MNSAKTNPRSDVKWKQSLRIAGAVTSGALAILCLIADEYVAVLFAIQGGWSSSRSVTGEFHGVYGFRFVVPLVICVGICAWCIFSLATEGSAAHASLEPESPPVDDESGASVWP